MSSERPEFGQPLPKSPRKRPPKVAPASPPDEDRVDDYRHEAASRLNLPEAGIATQDRSIAEPHKYEYDPHLDPQLVWAGKAEHTSFEVDTVSLHIHERVSTEAIMRAVRREEVQRTLFADPQLSPAQELDFYAHQTDWANRLILGDSLLVMNSLLRREGMAGKVQCIYVDPPYGVNYNSNFQPRTDQRDVRDGDDRSLTREPEQIRAYRDTWQLGIHSYLTYLRDRLLLAKDLLADSGSIFVQIGDQNLHHVRHVMSELFGAENEVALIPFRKTGGKGGAGLDSVNDYICWFSKDRSQLKYRQLYRPRPRRMVESGYTWLEAPDGTVRRLTSREQAGEDDIEGRRFQTSILVSQSGGETTRFPYELGGAEFRPSKNSYWKTNRAGMDALNRSGRLVSVGQTLAFKRYADDFPFVAINNWWDDTIESTYAVEKLYVVMRNAASMVASSIGRCHT